MSAITNGQATPDQLIMPVLAKHVDGNSWAHKLNFSVLHWAIRDAIGSPYMLTAAMKLDAVQYLQGPMPHAQAIGLCPSFIRSLISVTGVDLDELERESESEVNREQQNAIQHDAFMATLGHSSWDF